MLISKLVSALESEPVEPSLSCARICDEYEREARLIQSSLVPTKGLCHQSAEIAFRYIPFSDVGGDFADFFLLPDGFIGIYLGDVVGKGLPAAMYGALVMGILRGVHKSGTDTARVLTLLNSRLMQRPISGRFCSTLYALFNPATRELIFSNAGMPLPLLASPAMCRQLGDGGLPTAMFPDSTYERHVVQLSPGDCILFATDGLHELRSPGGVEFCTAQLKDVWAPCWRKSATEALDVLFDRKLAFSDGNAPHDDITAVVLKVLP
ncbi:MAG TPA: PP2C family protein-serine/threonine phosphatase [Gemmataceae bacterium]|nr:PP2C family protein-serine/threonine phosphatase [Gemmataceae bacterium]